MYVKYYKCTLNTCYLKSLRFTCETSENCLYIRILVVVLAPCLGKVLGVFKGTQSHFSQGRGVRPETFGSRRKTVLSKRKRS